MQKTWIGRLLPERQRSAARGNRLDMFAGMPPERLIPRSSRQGSGSRATGSALGVSTPTRLNLRHHPDHAALTALDLDLVLPSLARGRSGVFHHALLVQGDAAQMSVPTGRVRVRPLATTGVVQ